MKYIDAEKLKAEINRRCKNYITISKGDEYYIGNAAALDSLVQFIDFLQQEQPSAIRWYDVSLIPQEMEELLVECNNEDTIWYEIAFYHADTKTFWNGTRQVENVTRWCYIVDLPEKQKEQKPIEWSEEDELMRKRCIADLGYLTEYDPQYKKRYDEQIAWLKSLRPQTKQKWSEEDERMINVAIKSCEQTIEDYPKDKVRFKDCIAWLKSLCCQSKVEKEPEVDLEAEIDMYVDGWRESGNEYFGLVNDEGWSVTIEDIKNVARHFYGLGLNARKEE